MKLTGFEGRRALVTGAGGGIGAAVVIALRAAGATVVATDRHAPEGGLALDVRDADAVAALLAKEGPFDMGVLAAGVLATGQVTQTSAKDWRAVFAVNADGMFHTAGQLAAQMAAQRRGVIVGVGSNAAFVPRFGMAAYAASKAAATMFLRSLALEMGAYGVRVNVLAPGSTLTPMQTGMWADDSGAARVIAGQPDQFKAGIPLGKLATPDDIAAAAMFLLSDQAGHITSADLLVDGGATQRA